MTLNFKERIIKLRQEIPTDFQKIWEGLSKLEKIGLGLIPASFLAVSTTLFSTPQPASAELISAPVDSHPAVSQIQNPENQEEKIRIIYNPREERRISKQLKPSVILDTIGTENPQLNPIQTELIIPVQDLQKAINFLRKKMTQDEYQPFTEEAIIAYRLANEETARITGRDPLLTHPYSIGILKIDPNSQIISDKQGKAEKITSLRNTQITLVPLSNTRMGLYPEEYPYYGAKIAPYNIVVKLKTGEYPVYPVVFLNGVGKKYNEINKKDFSIVMCVPANYPDYPTQPFEKKGALPTQLIIYPAYRGLEFINTWNLTPDDNSTAFRYTLNHFIKNQLQGNPSVYIPVFDGGIPEEFSYTVIPFCTIGAPRQ